MNIFLNQYRFFLILSYLVPTILSTSYVLNQIYVTGSSLPDVGWFTYMMTESCSWPLLNPQALEYTPLGSTYFQTHFSLFFYILSFIYNYFLFFIPEPVYFSIFIGSMYGVISLSVFISGFKILSKRKLLYMMILLLISILTSFNGAALALIGFPHIEIAIPALILLFFALYFTDNKVLSYFIFILLLTIREDAGFHIFALLGTILFIHYLQERNLKKLDHRLIILAILGLIYGVFAVYIQKTYFPGSNALERVYLGNPHFVHLTYDFIIEKIKFLFENREYLYLPILFTILMSIYSKNMFLLSSFIAIIPWIILSFVAVSSMPSSFSNYYAFPFIITLAWPIFAFIIAKKLNFLQRNNFIHLGLSIFLITGVSILLFPNNKRNVDSKPWTHFYFNSYSSIYSAENFITKFNFIKDDFGNILVDEPMAVLLVHSITKNEYRYLNNFSDNLKKEADTVIFYKTNKTLGSPSKTIMNKIISNNNLKNICLVNNTNIVIATRKNNILESICN